jgi:hypothetical protein
MVNRVVLGALPGGGYGLRTSKPGANVLDANLPANQVSFDSRWPNAARVLKAGSISVPANLTANTYTTLTFGKTFAAPPPVFATQQNGSQFLPLVAGIMQGQWPDMLHMSPITMRVLTDRILFYRWTFATTVHYVIMDDL